MQVLGIFTVFAFVQTPLLTNLQLLLKKPNLLPDFSNYSPFIDLATTLIAALYLIIKWDHFNTPRWWRGFVSLAIAYTALKCLGIYYDHTVYLIAESTGTTIGGGAAMAHVPLFLALFGPLQILSAIGFSDYLERTLKHERNEKDQHLGKSS